MSSSPRERGAEQPSPRRVLPPNVSRTGPGLEWWRRRRPLPAEIHQRGIDGWAPSGAHYYKRQPLRGLRGGCRPFQAGPPVRILPPNVSRTGSGLERRPGQNSVRIRPPRAEARGIGGPTCRDRAPRLGKTESFWAGSCEELLLPRESQCPTLGSCSNVAKRSTVPAARLLQRALSGPALSFSVLNEGPCFSFVGCRGPPGCPPVARCCLLAGLLAGRPTDSQSLSRASCFLALVVLSGLAVQGWREGDE